MRTFDVEVQSDFLERLASARPAQAVAELVWNAVDADATDVRVEFEWDALGLMDAIVVRDNGTGIQYDEADRVFRSLGGSWKRETRRSKTQRRILHGQEGKGRFRALALGRIAEWFVVAAGPNNGTLIAYTITINRDRPRSVAVSDPKPAPPMAQRGVTVRVSELAHQWKLTTPEQIDELTTTFALYLTDYKTVSVAVDGLRLDPESKIADRKHFDLAPINVEGSPAVHLDVIEWADQKERAFYLCNEAGFPLSRVPAPVYAPGFAFAAYLRSRYIEQLHDANTLDIPEMSPELMAAVDEARDKLKAHFRSRAADRIKDLVQEWKEQHVYPYQDEPRSVVDRVQRQTFDVVAVQVATALPEFAEADPRTKKFQLWMLKQSIERGPEELQLILTEVLQLPQRQREDLAKLLRRTTLSAVISASRLVTDRLDFLTGLDALVFRPALRRGLKERSQLHRILADHTWLFGEEFALTVNDQALTEVLVQHLNAGGKKYDPKVVDREVVRPEGTPEGKRRGIVDLMLTRRVPTPYPNELHHLVIELKRPKKKLDGEDTNQLKSYAYAVMRDERFRNIKTRWTFWLVGNDISDFVHGELDNDLPRGMLQRATELSGEIWVKSWAEVLREAKGRLDFVRKELNYEPDRDESLAHLQTTYDRLLGDQPAIEPTPTEALNVDEFDDDGAEEDALQDDDSSDRT
jgi:hypothetical protein